MAKKNTKPSRDNTDRLRNVAFWYWEYMRRNPLYRRYSDVMAYYSMYFDSIGEVDYLSAESTMDEFTSSLYDEDCQLEDTKFNRYRREVEQKHGLKASKYLYKFSNLSCRFEEKFKRIWKPYEVGIEVEEYLDKLMKGESPSFISEEPTDIAALLRMYDGWAINVDGDMPDNFIYQLKTKGFISVDPEKLLSDPSSILLEAHALKMVYQSLMSCYQDQFFESETLDAVYKLSLSGKHINSSDEMRLLTLWLWDQAHEDDFENPKDFDEVYSLLKDKIEDAGMSDGVWEQVLYRKKRIFQYYETTHQSILQLAVLPLKSS